MFQPEIAERASSRRLFISRVRVVLVGVAPRLAYGRDVTAPKTLTVLGLRRRIMASSSRRNSLRCLVSRYWVLVKSTQVVGDMQYLCWFQRRSPTAKVRV